jgi:hypothetical protein
MGSTSNPAVTANIFQGGYDASYASMFSLMAFPQWYPELVKRYGAAFEVFEFLKFAGQETTCAGQTKTMYEVGAPERYVTLHAASTVVGAGADIVVEVSEWGDGQGTQVGVLGKSYVTVGDKIGIPGEYCTVSGTKCTMPQWYQVHTIATPTGTPNNDQTDITCTPLDKLTILAVEVPIGTKLMVTGGNYAPGSLGAKPKTQGYYSRTFTTAIKRTAFQVEGSQQSNERYTDHLTGGGMGIFSEASIKAEFRHNQALNYEILLGGTVDNMHMHNRDNDSSTVRGTLGIMPTLADRGCKQYYTSTYTIPDFDMIKKAFISQGVVDQSAALFVGSELLRGIENSGLEFLKEFAGGTTLMTNLNKLNVDFKTIKKNGITTTVHELVSFSNPNTLGNYGFDKKGFLVPNSQVTVRDSEMGADVKLANLTLAYKSYNGENRERVFKVIPGVNGLSQIPGNFAVDAYDDARWEILSEFMLLFSKANQSILIQPDSVL